MPPWHAAAAPSAPEDARGTSQPPTKPKPRKPHAGNQAALSTMKLLGLTLVAVAGGPFGFEDAIQAGGPLGVLGGLLLMPLFWCVPLAMLTAELASLIPENGGSIVWIHRAFGRDAAFLNGMLCMLSCALDAAMCPALFTDYVHQLVPGGLSQHARGVLIATVLFVVCQVNLIGGAGAVANASIATVCTTLVPVWIVIVLGLPHVLGIEAGVGASAAFGTAADAVVFRTPPPEFAAMLPAQPLLTTAKDARRREREGLRRTSSSRPSMSAGYYDNGDEYLLHADYSDYGWAQKKSWPRRRHVLAATTAQASLKSGNASSYKSLYQLLTTDYVDPARLRPATIADLVNRRAAQEAQKQGGAAIRIDRLAKRIAAQELDDSSATDFADDSGPASDSSSLPRFHAPVLLSLLLWHTSGYDVVGSAAGEVEDPSMSFPIALGVSLLVTICGDFLFIASCLMRLDKCDEWEDGTFVACARAFGGTPLAAAMTLAAAISMLGLLCSLLYFGSRMLYGMALVRSIPPVFARVAPRTGVPYVSVVAFTAFAGLFGALFDFKMLAGLEVCFYNISTLFKLAALPVLRMKYPDAEPHYQIPLRGLGLLTFLLPPAALSTYSIFAIESSDLVLRGTAVLLVATLGWVGFWVLRSRATAARRWRYGLAKLVRGKPSAPGDLWEAFVEATKGEGNALIAYDVIDD